MAWVPAANNCLTYPEDDVRDMLCATSSFQNWIGVANQSQAELYCFFHSLPSPDDTRWPEDSEVYSAEFWSSLQNYVVLYTSPEEGFILEYAAAPNEFLSAGVITVEFVRFFNGTMDESLDEDTRTAMNEIGSVLVDISSLAGTATYPSINAFRLLSFDWEPEDQRPDVGRNFRMVWDWDWSMGNNLAGGSQ